MIERPLSAVTVSLRSGFLRKTKNSKIWTSEILFTFLVKKTLKTVVFKPVSTALNCSNLRSSLIRCRCQGVFCGTVFVDINPHVVFKKKLRCYLSENMSL